MKDFTPGKVFILVNGGYQEITPAEHHIRREKDEEYKARKFIGLHGMIMEVGESDYLEHYRAKRRQKYLAECAADRGDLSYDALDSDEFNGEGIVIDPNSDLTEKVFWKAMTEKLPTVISMLSDTETELIYALFYLGTSEREYARHCGVSQVAIHKRKVKVLKKLKNLLEG